jgi:hypothetical protein
MEINAHQKLGLVFFIVLGIGTIGVGVMRFDRAINDPLKKTGTFEYRTVSELEAENEQRLRTQDSDADGVTDYDELRIFRTSPFLDDSDSDGMKDGDEIARSSDPNCPKGRTCREASVEASAPAPTGTSSQAGGASADAAIAADAVAQAITETFGDIQTLTPEKIEAELARMDGPKLRAFLTKLGIPQEALQKADDTTLRSVLQQTMEEIAAGATGSAAAQANP